jgi:hypothetical protein
MSTTTTTLRLAGVDVPISLDARQWGLLACLLRVHSKSPIMSPFDTEALGAIGIELERQLETRCREAQP